MKVSAPELVDSPRGPDWTRAQVHVSYQALLPARERVWFDVPASLREQVSPLGDPWLTVLLPLAVTRGEAIELEAAISDEKRANAERLLRIWSDWHAQFEPVPIEAPRAPANDHGQGRLSGCFFSGGVDSFYSVLHDRATRGGTIDELIFLHGADIPIDREVWFQSSLTSIRRIAEELDLPLLTMATNARATRFREANYDALASGSLLAAAGLLLGARYQRLTISSTWGAEELHPAGGSHPETDPLLSNGSTQVEHYGAWTNRTPKLTFLSDYPLALRNLRVCWEGETGGNCGRCLKCLRTMTALEILGLLPHTTTFEWDQLDLEFLRRQVITREMRYFRGLLETARERGRADVAEAIEAALDRSARLQRRMLFGFFPAARKKLYMNRHARRWLAPIYHALRRCGIWLGRRFGHM